MTRAAAVCSLFLGLGFGLPGVFGNSFASFLVTDREIEGGGHNRVLGPDFQWRPSDSDAITGQLLVSDTDDPAHREQRRIGHVHLGVVCLVPGAMTVGALTSAIQGPNNAS